MAAYVTKVYSHIRTAYYHTVNPQISPLPNKASLFRGRKSLSPSFPPPPLQLLHYNSLINDRLY